MPASLKKQVRVLNYFRKHSTEEVGDRILVECKKIKGRRRNGNNPPLFLRWNGSGDLFPGSVRVINYVANKDPDIIHWVVTRKPKEVANIEELPNIYVMFSLDSSPESGKKLKQIRKHERMYFSFLRRHENEDTSGAQIVFNAQKSSVSTLHDSDRCCPVDSGIIPLKGGCERCRKCFTEEILR
jgi:hypothetical protein